MPDFAYTARNGEGQKVNGTIEAATQAEAIAALSARSLFPISVAASAASVAGERAPRVSPELLAATFSQLADLLNSGVPHLRALNVLRGQSSHQGLKHILGEISRRVEDGETLADAMDHFHKVFGEMTINIVRAGAEGGFLEQSLEQIATFIEAQDDMKKQVIGALAYPCVIATVMVGVVAVMLMFVVPKFEPAFATLREKGELPWLTQVLLETSNQALIGGAVLFVLTIAGVIAYKFWTKTDQGRLTADGWKLKIPMAGPLYQAFAVARFCRILGTLLANGVPILRALNISADVSGNKVLGDAIRRATENISSGERLATPLAASRVFPQSVIEMISVAEESNTLDTVLPGIAERLEKRAWRRLDIAIRLLEPMMLVVLAGVVLVIVLALLVPMFKLSQAI